MGLGDIALKDFLDVYFGDFSVLEGTEEERVKQASEMCMEYFQIVGGKQVAVQMLKRDKVLKIEMRGSVLEACEKLLLLDEPDAAIEVMRSMGYQVTRENIVEKIRNVRHMDAYALKKMEEEDVQGELTREHFVKERCFIMGHLKMHIDERVFTAKEYAYLVKQVGDEVEAMMKANREVKR